MVQSLMSPDKSVSPLYQLLLGRVRKRRDLKTTTGNFVR